MSKPKQILVHFSGGSDSTLVAGMMAEKYDLVHMITYNRFSFRGVKDSQIHFKALCDIYGEHKFKRIPNYPIGKWYEAISTVDKLYYIKKYKTASSLPCGPCKLSFHWHSIIYCLDNNISFIADGTVPYMDLYPDQNRKILTDKLRKFYKHFGIEYLTPVYEIGEQVEQKLYDKGITKMPQIRGTENDRQVYCSEQVLFANFVKYYKDKYGKNDYEQVLSDMYREKIDYMQQEVESYLKDKKESKIYNLLEANEK